MERQYVRSRAASLPAALAAMAALLCGCSGSGGTSQPAPSGTAVSPAPSAPNGSSAPHQPSAAPPAASPTLHTTGPAPAGRPPWCTTADLRVSVHALQPAAGNRYAALRLTDSTSHQCRTEGYPGLQLVDAAGRPLPTDAVRNTSVRPLPITLGPGGSAWSRLHWTDVAGSGDSPAGSCEPPPAAIRVTPPDRTTASAALWQLGPVCLRGRITERPLTAGSGPAF